MQFLTLLLNNKPPDDKVFSDTPIAPHYTGKHARGQLSIYIEMPMMAIAEPLLLPLTAENRKLDSKHVMVSQVANKQSVAQCIDYLASRRVVRTQTTQPATKK